MTRTRKVRERGREGGRNETAYQIHSKKGDSSNEELPLPH